MHTLQAADAIKTGVIDPQTVPCGNSNACGTPVANEQQQLQRPNNTIRRKKRDEYFASGVNFFFARA
jgi:hypothetical protein